jgi:hypothetical protein
MVIRFTQAARRHRIGGASVLWVMASTTPTAITTNGGGVAWRWIGPDERGRELDVIAVEVQGAKDATPILLVIHVMPNYQRGTPS